MNIRNIINDWYRLAVSAHTTDPFFQFIAIWIAFNALYVSRYHGLERNARVRDHKYVKRFAQERANVRQHRHLLVDQEYREAVVILAEHGVLDVINGKRYEIKKKEDLLAVLEVVYQVRCNLFHGGKLVRDPRDKQLTRASFTIIKRLLQSIIDE